MKSIRSPFLALLLVPAVLQAQTGALRGTVHDEEGRAVGGAQVVVAGTARATVTDASGGFHLPGVSVGTRRVEVALLGYAGVSTTVTVGTGAETVVALTLRRTPLALPGIQVTATPSPTLAAGGTRATGQLAGTALDREMRGTVAETLRGEPGVTVRSMGPAAAMPVLRGLTGDRVLVLQDGQRTADLAGSADDHAVTLDALSARRVEVVRGPAALLYGSNALGGVVNVVSGDLPRHLPGRGEWSLAAQATSAHPGVAATLRGTGPLGGGWVGTARFGGRAHGMLRIPAEPELGRRLGNTDAESWSGAAGVGRIGELGSGGVAVRAFRFGYGLPVPPGTDPVRLDGWRMEGQGSGERIFRQGALEAVSANATVQTYAHDERDDEGAALQRFALNTASAGLLLRQRAGSRRHGGGTWGASLLLREHRAEGPEALTPPATSRGIGVFGYQEVDAGGGVRLEAGARWDAIHVASRTEAKFGEGSRRRFDALSASLGGRLPLGEGVSARASFVTAFRPPSVEELFSSAAHAGTGAVELGDPSLRAERARAVEAGLRGEGARWTGELSLYRKRIDGYVHLVARGDTLLDGARLPVLAYAQASATLVGAEAAVELSPARDLVLALSGDALRGALEGGTPLSYMPAPRIGAALRWDDGRRALGGELRHTFAQRRVGDADELPTPAHTLASVSATLRLGSPGGSHALTLRLDNLTGARHREPTSRIKDFAPGPGRDVSLLYRVAL